jgi:hypothetical protein
VPGAQQQQQHQEELEGVDINNAAQQPMQMIPDSQEEGMETAPGVAVHNHQQQDPLSFLGPWLPDHVIQGIATGEQHFRGKSRGHSLALTGFLQ